MVVLTPNETHSQTKYTQSYLLKSRWSQSLEEMSMAANKTMVQVQMWKAQRTEDLKFLVPLHFRTIPTKVQCLVMGPPRHQNHEQEFKTVNSFAFFFRKVYISLTSWSATNPILSFLPMASFIIWLHFLIWLASHRGCFLVCNTTRALCSLNFLIYSNNSIGVPLQRDVFFFAFLHLLLILVQKHVGHFAKYAVLIFWFQFITFLFQICFSN